MKPHYPVCFLSILSLFVTSLAASYFGSNEQCFAHFAAGGGSITNFALHNPTDSPIKVKVELYNSRGQLVLSETQGLEAFATETVSVGATLPELTSGWVRLTSLAPFTSTEFFQLRVGNLNLPRVGVLPCGAVSEVKLFCFREGTRTNTGVESPTQEIQLQKSASISGGRMVDWLQPGRWFLELENTWHGLLRKRSSSGQWGTLEEHFTLSRVNLCL